MGSETTYTHYPKNRRDQMTDAEWQKFQDEHAPEEHYDDWLHGYTCNCQWWYSDLDAFESEWWGAGGTKVPRVDMIGAAIDARIRNGQWAGKENKFDVVWLVENDKDFITFDVGCPICDYPQKHSHLKDSVREALGETNYNKLMQHMDNTKPQTQKEQNQVENIYRLRVIDRSRKLAVVRVMKGKRRDAIKASMSSTVHVLGYTKLPSTVDLARCEPIVPFVKDKT